MNLAVLRPNADGGIVRKRNIVRVRKSARLPKMSCAEFLGTDMKEVRKSLRIQHEAQHLRALAPDYDPVRHNFDCELADVLELGIETAQDAHAQGPFTKWSHTNWRRVTKGRWNS